MLEVRLVLMAATQKQTTCILNGAVHLSVGLQRKNRLHTILNREHTSLSKFHVLGRSWLFLTRFLVAHPRHV